MRRLVGIEANLGVRPAAGFLLSEVNESATDPLALMTRVDGDIVEKQMVFFLEQDEDTGNLAGQEIAAMGDGERRARLAAQSLLTLPRPSRARQGGHDPFARLVGAVEQRVLRHPRWRG